MTITTIIVNGFPRVGKDSFVEACKSHLEDRGIRVEVFSSIDPVRDLMTEAGIDVSAKTEADRKLLAVVGAAMEEHSNWRTKMCLDLIHDCGVNTWLSSKDTVVFLHMREPENIKKVIAGIAERDLGMVHTVLLRGQREVFSDNAADRGVLGMKYGNVLLNNSTLDDLHVLAGNYLNKKGLI